PGIASADAPCRTSTTSVAPGGNLNGRCTAPEAAASGAVQRPFRLPPGATEVVLVRHGASAEAIPGAPFPLLDGRGDPPLSESVARQSELVAQRLAREEISKLFVTPL